MTNFAAFGAGVVGTALGSYAAIHYLESRLNLGEHAQTSKKDNVHSSGRYVAIDLASWSVAMSVSRAFAKKGTTGRTEMTDFLFIATATGLIFSYVFFNWLTQPLNTQQSSWKMKYQIFIGASAFLAGNLAWITTLYFLNRR